MKVDHRAQLRHPEHPNPSASLKAARAVGLQGQTVESRDGVRGVAPAGTLQSVESGGRIPAARDFAAPLLSLDRGAHSEPASIGERPGGEALGKDTVLVSPVERAKLSRRGRYRLRDGLRSYQPSREKACGYHLAGEARAVDLRLSAGRDRLHLGATMRCESLWLCPVCSAQGRSQAVDDVRKVVERHLEATGPGSALFASFTVRHGCGDDFRRTAQGVADAFRALQAGKKWQAIRERHGATRGPKRGRSVLKGGVSSIRVLEVTHGANGFHPHLHVIFLLDRPVAKESQEGAPFTFAEWSDFFTRRWSASVNLAFKGDARFAPSDEHGVDLRLAASSEGTGQALARYLAKVGGDVCSVVGAARELVDVGGKKGRRGSRSMWQVAEDLAASTPGSNKRDEAIWRSFIRGIYRRQYLTWSEGLRERYGVKVEEVELTDDGGEEGFSHRKANDREIDVIARIPGSLWRRMRDRVGAAVEVLELVESALACPVPVFDLPLEPPRWAEPYLREIEPPVPGTALPVRKKPRPKLRESIDPRAQAAVWWWLGCTLGLSRSPLQFSDQAA